jgi:translation initiation factor 2A
MLLLIYVQVYRFPGLIFTKYFYAGKEGPIYSVEWSPKSSEFCVVYGFMPSKATLFNIKCEPVFEFGTGPRNCIYYNPHGNNILLSLSSCIKT